MARDFALDNLPEPGDVPWAALRDIPTAIVTGSNGKTTTVRLIAACAQAHGWHAGFNCTDGVFVDGEALLGGDYSGPAGARRVMRDRQVEAAVIESARGGILRRGLAIWRAQVAVVTNVSPDHFGEYGIYDLDGLADLKLSVAAVVDAEGLLVLNADDALLSNKVRDLKRRYGRCPPLGWFALDADHPRLREHREAGGSTCGVRNRRLALTHAGTTHDLGVVAAMPLTVDSRATYNTANLAAAALSAIKLGIAVPTITTVFARFGANAADNPGRLMRYNVGGVCVLVDYAHNPDGLRGLLQVARHLRREGGRLALLLGHAGNRQDEDLKAVARVAAESRPDLIVVKEDESMLRGRAPGEIPAILRATLLECGLPDSALPVRMSELEAATYALDWARPGDVLVLPMHSTVARSSIVALLERRSRESAPPV